MVGMEENAELEEGEASYYGDDEDKIIDPDISLSYIDEKIRSVLGHFQKDFEGGVSAENLGAKFGGYGSFLPTYERSPSIWSRPKTPPKNYNAPRSPNNIPIEGASQNFKAPSNKAPSLRLGTATCSAHPLHNSKRVASADVSIKQNQVAEKSPLKDESSNRSGNLTDQRTLKVRIKVGCDNLARKNAAIYSGLGLDDSPNSSLGNSPAESGGMSPISGEMTDMSPTGIIQAMTSFPIPGGVLISPIHDSLLCLVKKDKLSVSKPMPPLNGRQEHPAILVDELASMMGNRKVLKEKKAKLVAKSERQLEVKHENGTYFEDDMSFQTKKISVNETTGGKEFLPGDLKSMHVSKSESDVRGSLKVAGGGSEVFREGYKDGGKVRLRSSELVKEEASESIFGEDCSKNEKGNPSSLVQNVHGNRVLNPHRDVLIDRNDDGNCHKISASLQGYSNGSKCKEDLNPQKEKVGWKTENDETSVPFKTEGLSLEGKNKSKGAQSNGKSVPVSTKESPRFGASADLNNKKNTGYLVADCNSKSQRIKSQKDDKGRDNQRDSLLAPKLEQKDNQMDPVRRSSGDRPKDANLDSFGMQQNAFLDKQKGRISGKKVDGQDISGASIKDASIVRPITETGLTSEIVPPMAAPVLIEEDWVQCDRCQKWRLLPYGTKPEQLPDKWLCSMLNWLHGMNHCNISEEETTKALNALYQLPVSESQNNLQNHVSGTALGVYLGDVQHLDQNHQNVSAQAAANRGKKKHGLKEIANAGSPDGPFQISKSTKNKLQESMKSRSINGKNQRHAELNLMKKSSSQHLSKKGNLVVDKDMLSQKDKPIDGGHQLSAGDVKQIKMKSKREADEYGGGTSKKSKTEDKSYADKHRTSKMDSDRGHISAITALPTKGSGKDMRKYDEYCLSEDTKLDVRDKVLVSVKKLGDQAQVLSDGGSLDMTMCSKKDVSLKKRKLELEDDRNEIVTFQNSAHDGSVYEKEGSSESGLRKEKKFRVSKIQVKESNTNDSDDKSHKRGRMSEILLSGIRDHPSDTMEEVRRNDKEQQLRKHKKKNSSQPTVDVAESLRRDLGSGQISVAATSSSSKVSGSRKTRANIEELKGSPVESVSSSPLRTSNLDKFTGKDDAMHGGLSMMGDFRRYSDGDNTAEINLPGTVIHPESRKFSVLEYRDGDASHKFSGKAKPSSEFGNSHMLNSHVRMVEQNARFLNDLHAPEHGYNEDGVKKNHHDNSVLQKSGKGTTTLSKGKSRSSTSESDRDKMKVSDPVNGYTKKSHRNHSESDPNHRVPVHETTANAKHGFPKNPSTKFVKDEKNHVSSRDPVGQWSSETQMEIKFKQKEYDGLDVKSCAPCSRDVKLAPQLSLIQDFEGENKADPTQIEPRNGKSKLFSLSDGESKLETVSQGCGPVLGRQKGDMFDGCPIDAPGDVSKALKHSGNVNYNGISHSMGHLVPDRQGVRDLNASSPVRVISSSQTATNTLKEAKDLRDTADRLKSSCFGFESNEAYFQAALKFLHGASLLETCSSENGRHGEMNQIQAYGTAAKLCELCALEYETRQEMAAAALAYKCLEVAYMRVVYCKHSSMSRDRHELQATLQVVPQGESPSSSASDVDNLNNQAPVDKGNLSKGTGSHVAGSQVILARNRPNFVRLLDFTQDVNFAMEASRKSHNAFAAANVILEEEQNKDCITSAKRVIDFSFQDVEELVRLVRLAMEAISRSGFGGARD